MTLVEGRETHDGANASPFVHLDDLLDCLHTSPFAIFPSFKHGFAAFAFRIVQIQMTGHIVKALDVVLISRSDRGIAEALL